MTHVGAASHYSIGKGLREEFNKYNLLDLTKFNPDEIYVQTTDKERTQHSAIAQIQGLLERDY